MTTNPIVRIWKEVDIGEIKPRLLISGSLGCDCASCKEVGIPFESITCPKCRTAFKYIATRGKNSAKEAKRLHRKRPDLIIIDLEDFKAAQARTSARGIFGILLILISCLYFVNIAGIYAAYANVVDDIMPISKDKEKKVGDSIAKQVEKQFEFTDDPLLQKRFEAIGQRIIKASGNEDFVYHFKVLKSGPGPKENYYNAFALPGGHVYMFDAMIEMLDTDNEIAAVTAHEIGHITARHAVKRMQGSLGINALMILAAALANDGGTVARTNEAIGQMMMSYSRSDEFEADKLSVEYTRKAGFDPTGVTQSLTKLKELRKKGREMKYRNYKTHPYLSERIAVARKEIKGYTDFDSYINVPEQTDGFY